PAAVQPLFEAKPAPEPEPLDLADMQSSDDEPETEVAGAVGGSAEQEPVATADSEDADDTADSDSYASLTADKPARREPLDLDLEQVDDVPDEEDSPGSDELLLDASRLENEDAPVLGGFGRRTGSAPEEPKAAASGGSTLFERMANLSRGGKPAASEANEDDEEESDDGSSISIPRFLGRQNNQ
ncbi:MAG: cell division protein FtsZ, partial [Novosphingobium sp.]|nr:cell division protein FtsZ [Novosphingobium sp.]